MYFWTKHKNRNSEKCVHLSYKSSLKCHSALWHALNVNYFQNFVAWREMNALKIHFSLVLQEGSDSQVLSAFKQFFAFCLLSSRGRTLNTVYVCERAYILLNNTAPSTAGNIHQVRSYFSPCEFATWLDGKEQRLSCYCTQKAASVIRFYEDFGTLP